MAGKRAGSFRKDHHRHTFLQNLTCLLIGLAYLGRPTLVNKNLMGTAASYADNGNGTQLALHHPFEVAVEEPIYQEYIESPLMIGHKNVTLLWVEMLASLHLHRQQ